MLDSLAGFLTKGMNSIGDLFGGGSSVAGGMTPWTTDSSLMNNPALKGGDMTSLLGRGVDASGMGSLAGMFKGVDLMDLGKLGLGYMGMQETKKNNKLNRNLMQQNIDENNRITTGRERAANIFNGSLAGGNY